MSGAKAYATTAGFESVCEAMYLGKPVLMIPVHIEQACNAYDASIAGAGIKSDYFDLDLLQSLSETYKVNQTFREWVRQADWLILREFNQDLLYGLYHTSRINRLLTTQIGKLGKYLPL